MGRMATSLVAVLPSAFARVTAAHAPDSEMARFLRVRGDDEAIVVAVQGENLYAVAAPSQATGCLGSTCFRATDPPPTVLHARVRAIDRGPDAAVTDADYH